VTAADEAPAFIIPVSNVLPSEEAAKCPAESTFFHVTVPPAVIVTLFGTKHLSSHLVFVAVPLAISTTAAFTGADAAVVVVFLPVATDLSVAFGEAFAEGCGVFLVVAFGEAFAEGCGVFLSVAFTIDFADGLLLSIELDSADAALVSETLTTAASNTNTAKVANSLAFMLIP
jgi:hypothetical protein